MPAKGDKYAAINIDLTKWLKDYQAEHHLTLRALSDKLEVEEGRTWDVARVHGLKNGKYRTYRTICILVENLYDGNYEKMLPYVLDEEARRWLRDKQFFRHLKPDQEDEYYRIITFIRSCIKDEQKWANLLKLLRCI